MIRFCVFSDTKRVRIADRTLYFVPNIPGVVILVLNIDAGEGAFEYQDTVVMIDAFEENMRKLTSNLYF